MENITIQRSSLVAAYRAGNEEQKQMLEKLYGKEVFAGLPDKLEKQIENEKISLVHSGYMYSYPDWFIRKKSAYIALRDALKQCEEFMDNIKSLL